MRLARTFSLRTNGADLLRLLAFGGCATTVRVCYCGNISSYHFVIIFRIISKRAFTTSAIWNYLGKLVRYVYEGFPPAKGASANEKEPRAEVNLM